MTGPSPLCFPPQTQPPLLFQEARPGIRPASSTGDCVGHSGVTPGIGSIHGGRPDDIGREGERPSPLPAGLRMLVYEISRADQPLESRRAAGWLALTEPLPAVARIQAAVEALEQESAAYAALVAATARRLREHTGRQPLRGRS